jgi:hypothetical protein
MGRIPLYSYRLSCRISKGAGETIEEMLGRISYGRKKPMGKILSLLIRKTSDETWQEILKKFSPKPWAELTKKEEKRRIAERQMERQIRKARQAETSR